MLYNTLTTLCLARDIAWPCRKMFLFFLFCIILLSGKASAQEPFAMFLVPPGEICAPANLTFTNFSSGGDTYTWYINGSQEQQTNTPEDLVWLFTNTGTSSETYNIRLVVEDGTGGTDEITRSVNIYPEIVASFTAHPVNGCHPLEVNFTNNSTGHTGTWEWNFGDGGSSFLSDHSHTYHSFFDPDDISYIASLTATSPLGCKSTVSEVITVSPHIEALFTVDNITGCHELDVTINDLSTIWGSTYRWNLGDGTPEFITGPGEEITHTYINNTGVTQIYTITLTVEKGECKDEMQKDVIVYPNVTADFTAIPETGCSQLSVSFRNNSSGASWYEWDFGDGGTSAENNPVHTYEKNLSGADQVYQARLIAVSEDLCRDTTEYVDITVLPHVEADFTLNVAAGCQPITVTINNNSIGADSYLWEFSDGSPDSDSDDASFTRTFVNTTGSIQTYIISLTASTEDCTHVLEKEITVYPAVNAGFTPEEEDGCSPLTVGFNNSSTGASQYLWEFGDGGTSLLFEPEHTYEKNLSGADKVYQVRLIAVSEELCRDTTDYTDITVFPYVEANFTLDAAEGCHPLTVTLTDLSTGGDNYQWVMGDGTTYGNMGTSFSHSYSNTGNSPETFTIGLSLETTRGCTDYFEKEIMVYPELTSHFTVDIDEGCNPLTVNFINESGNAQGYLWNFGDGATSYEEHPRHTFHNPGVTDTTFRVLLTSFAANGECADLSEMDITVNGIVEAEFSIAGIPGCNPLEVEFINSSTGAERYEWDFGDGTLFTTASTDPFTHIFPNSSFSDIMEYTVRLTAYNYADCSHEKIMTVRVYPDISALFSASATEGCHPFTVDFTNLTEGGYHYSWDFGDGNTSSGVNPRHTFTNTGTTDSIYRVKLLSTAGNNVCNDSFFMDIIVHPYLRADFNFSGSPDCTPFDLMLENASVNGAEFHWNFGDGNDSTTYNTDPFIYRFENSDFYSVSEYQVSLRAVSNEGCESETDKTVRVYPDIVAEFEANTEEGCHPLTVNFTGISQGAVHYEWDFGDGSSSPETSPVHTFTNTGSTDSIYRVKLLATAPNNVCRDSFFVDIRVHPYVKSDFSFDENIQCSPAVFNFNNSSVGGNLYRWDFGDGSDSITHDLNAFSRTFINSDYTGQVDFTVTLETENYAGCTDRIQRTVHVHPNIRAAVIPSTTEGCHPLHVDFDNVSPGGYTYVWDFGDGSATDKDYPLHIFTNFSNSSITREVKLSATSRDFCQSDTSFTITIHPLPKPYINIDRSVSCPPFDLMIGNDTEGAESYTWVFGDGESMLTTASDPFTHTYYNSSDEITRYDLKLIAETEFGCVDSAQQKLFVYPSVVTSFTSITEGCSPLIVRFFDQSVRAATHEWDFGDGSFSRQKDPTYQYFNNSVNDTTYYVQQVGISQYGCSDTMGYYIEVFPQPVSEFAALPTHQTWPSARIELENLTNPGYWDFTWDFDDGHTSTERDPGYHDFGDWGEYDIKLHASSSNCSHSISHRIRILAPPPIVEFHHPGPGCVPHAVQFVNNSVYGHTYFWEFGDGNTSEGIEPLHVYEEAGLYNVKLTVTGEGGTEFAYREVEVYRQPVAKFMVSPELAMLPRQKVQLFNQSEYGARYLWDFGDGTQSTLENPLHQYTETGSYDVRLSIWTADECYGELIKYSAVRVTGEGLLKFPNAFRPDQSGPSGGYYDRDAVNPNTVFYPLHSGIEEYHLEIYNRWGELLFVSKDVETGCDGYYRGQLSNQDVYVWKVWGRYINGEKFLKAGDVTLLR